MALKGKLNPRTQPTSTYRKTGKKSQRPGGKKSGRRR